MLECMELWSIIKNKTELMNCCCCKTPKFSVSNRSKHSFERIWRKNLPPSARWFPDQAALSARLKHYHHFPKVHHFNEG